MLKSVIKNNLKSVKKTVTNLRTKLRNRNNFKADTHWISLGENCLPDDILRRHNRKSYSSVYASGRSNIEYILEIEKDRFKNLLTAKYLHDFPDGTHSVLRSIYYTDCHNYYSDRHMLGFEFSHHNPLKIKEDLRAFRRRIKRALDARQKQNFMFMYHHRINERSNLPFIRERLEELISMYSSNTARCQVIFFWQNIIPVGQKSHVEFIPHPSGILEFVCHTHQIWGGDDLDIFWARNDDQLFTDMFRTVDNWNSNSTS